MGLGGVFSVEWLHKECLPFHCTQHILNPWNDNKEVQISRDGQVRGLTDPDVSLCIRQTREEL